MIPEPASADLLSQVLGQIRLAGDRVFARKLVDGEILSLRTQASHVCIVIAGALRSDHPDIGPIICDAGDLLLLSRGNDEVGLVAMGDETSVIIGQFSFDAETLHGLIFSLPRCIRISRIEGQGWLEGLVHFLLIEAEDTQPGASLMISRLIDLAVIRTLRSWVQQRNSSGWLGGLADPRIARALKALHDRPMQPWSISSLAAIAGMSRSNFCEHFTALVGRAPLRYRNELRLNLARDMLLDPAARVGEIGLRVGYESEATFSRAYKAQFGRSPRADARARVR